MLNRMTLTEATGLNQAAGILSQLEGCTQLKIYIKPNKVTASAVFSGRSIGSRGSSLPDALAKLQAKRVELERELKH